MSRRRKCSRSRACGTGSAPAFQPFCRQGGHTALCPATRGWGRGGRGGPRDGGSGGGCLIGKQRADDNILLKRDGRIRRKNCGNEEASGVPAVVSSLCPVATAQSNASTAAELSPCNLEKSAISAACQLVSTSLGPHLVRGPSSWRGSFHL